jgi:hypothetical protein
VGLRIPKATAAPAPTLADLFRQGECYDRILLHLGITVVEKTGGGGYRGVKEIWSSPRRRLAHPSKPKKPRLGGTGCRGSKGIWNSPAEET